MNTSHVERKGINSFKMGGKGRVYSKRETISKKDHWTGFAGKQGGKRRKVQVLRGGRKRKTKGKKRVVSVHEKKGNTTLTEGKLMTKSTGKKGEEEMLKKNMTRETKEEAIRGSGSKKKEKETKNNKN